jgi:hypothetical protein
MDLARTIILLFSVMGFAWWAGTVMKAEGDDKLKEACHPVDFVTTQLIKVATGLSGFTPQWTLGTKKVLVGGCYYFFSTFLFAKDLGEGQVGGVHQ